MEWSSTGTAKPDKQDIGKRGEEKASLFLSESGYEIIERNFRVRRAEIDIIAWHEKKYHGRTLCFIEVKTRQHDDGSAERAAGWQKQEHWFIAARAYCRKQKINIETTPIQFEQVSVYLSSDEIRHFVIPVN